MSTITQTTQVQAVLAWLGSTEEEDCVEFDLAIYKDSGGSPGIINKVYQLNSTSSTTGPIGQWSPNTPPVLDNLNGAGGGGKLVCGSCYMLQIEPAVDILTPATITIPGAILAYGDQPGKGSVFNKDSSKPQFLGDISNLPSCICKGEFRNLITDAQSGTNYSSATTLTPDQDGIYIKSDGSVHRIFSGKSFEIPAGSKLLKGKFGTLDTDGDGVPDVHDNAPSTSDRDSTGSSGSSGSTSSAQVSFLGIKPIKIEDTNYPDFNQEYNHVGGRLSNWATDPSYSLDFGSASNAGTMGWSGNSNPSGGWPVYQGVQNPNVYIMKIGFSSWRIGYRGTAQWSNTGSSTHQYAIDFDFPSMGVRGGTDIEQLQEAAARSGWFYHPGGNANIVTGVPITATVIE